LLLIAASEEERHGWVSQLNSAITAFYASAIGMDFQLSDMKTKSPLLPPPDKKALIFLSGLEVQYLLKALHMPSTFSSVARARVIDGRSLASIASYDDVIKLGFVSSNDEYTRLLYGSMLEFKADGVPLSLISPHTRRDKQSPIQIKRYTPSSAPSTSSTSASSSSSNVELDVNPIRRESIEEFSNQLQQQLNITSTIKGKHSDISSWGTANGFNDINNNINCTNESGYSTVLWAAKTGNNNILQLLLDNRGDPNASNEFGKSALHYGIEQNNTGIIHLLLDVSNNASSDNATCENRLLAQSALAFAATMGKVKSLQGILDKCGNRWINDRDADGKTPLILAVENNHFEAVKILSKQGADVNAIDDFGFSAPVIAASKGYVNILTYFITNCGVDVNTVWDDRGRTLLMIAVLSKQTDIVSLLVGYNANVRIQDSAGRTALDIANKHKFTEAVEVLKNFR
jgi:ankyrin repeat protein